MERVALVCSSSGRRPFASAVWTLRGMFRPLYIYVVFVSATALIAPSPLAPNHEDVLRTPSLHLTERDGRLLVQSGECQILLIESMPENLTYSADSPKHASTFFAWNVLLDHVSERLSIASFYWSLLAEPKFNMSAVVQGQKIYDALLAKAKTIDIDIAQSGPKKGDEELDRMVAAGAHVHWVDVAKLLGAGVLHTKLWIADRKHAYLGSANMDWRSLTEVKELGALIVNCPPIVEDLNKVHGAYCLAETGIPNKWPAELITIYNHKNPMRLTVNGIRSRVYISGSPREFNAPGRTFDLDAILSTIARATQFVYVSVMDYSPEIVNYTNFANGRYWPPIDDALRRAAVDRDVEVRLLVSRWPYTSPTMTKYLTSLKALNGIRRSRIRIRYFEVPVLTIEQHRIPHARVNHNKYMVTDKAAYVGTSNWSGDYFLYTGGAALVIEDELEDDPISSDTNPKTLRAQLTDIFLRDWNSEYSFEE
ncbi:phospholipase D3/4 [Paragonimus westermani]|uniref:Phospholipase D3/4 n=1 Tax=Paragonimus westermani TaxID=34504 RepID=A0A5J4NWM5_9TREM|nr:phospholipase D3/4 [Paragonimus westermani]